MCISETVLAFLSQCFYLCFPVAVLDSRRAWYKDQLVFFMAFTRVGNSASVK